MLTLIGLGNGTGGILLPFGKIGGEVTDGNGTGGMLTLPVCVLIPPEVRIGSIITSTDEPSVVKILTVGERIGSMITVGEEVGIGSTTGVGVPIAVVMLPVTELMEGKVSRSVTLVTAVGSTKIGGEVTVVSLPEEVTVGDSMLNCGE